MNNMNSSCGVKNTSSSVSYCLIAQTTKDFKEPERELEWDSTGKSVTVLSISAVKFLS